MTDVTENYGHKCNAACRTDFYHCHRCGRVVGMYGHLNEPCPAEATAVTDTPLTAEELAALKQEGLPVCIDWPFCKSDCAVCDERDSSWERTLATIATLTTRAEQAEARLEADSAHFAGCRQTQLAIQNDALLARVAVLTAALTEQGLLQKRADGSMVWHVHDCPASFDFAQCNYRCRVAREAFALAGTEPYVSEETRRDTEVYE